MTHLDYRLAGDQVRAGADYNAVADRRRNTQHLPRKLPELREPRRTVRVREQDQRTTGMHHPVPHSGAFTPVLLQAGNADLGAQRQRLFACVFHRDIVRVVPRPVVHNEHLVRKQGVLECVLHGRKRRPPRLLRHLALAARCRRVPLGACKRSTLTPQRLEPVDAVVEHLAEATLLVVGRHHHSKLRLGQLRHAWQLLALLRVRCIDVSALFTTDVQLLRRQQHEHHIRHCQCRSERRQDCGRQLGVQYERRNANKVRQRRSTAGGP